MLKRIKRWYEGEFIPRKNDPNSPVLFTGGHYKRHWTARVARAIVEFYLREWKWVYGAVSTLAGLAIAFHRMG